MNANFNAAISVPFDFYEHSPKLETSCQLSFKVLLGLGSTLDRGTFFAPSWRDASEHQ